MEISKIGNRTENSQNMKYKSLNHPKNEIYLYNKQIGIKIKLN